MKAIQITASNFCAGILFEWKQEASNGRGGWKVKETAPKLYYMRYWSLGRIATYCRTKGWSCKSV